MVHFRSIGIVVNKIRAIDQFDYFFLRNIWGIEEWKLHKAFTRRIITPIVHLIMKNHSSVMLHLDVIIIIEIFQATFYTYTGKVSDPESLLLYVGFNTPG
jgi:hypothetical protein